MTRDSTPKYEVAHCDGAVVLTGVSKTDAVKFAREMNKGGPKAPRFSVRPARAAIQEARS